MRLKIGARIVLCNKGEKMALEKGGTRQIRGFSKQFKVSLPDDAGYVTDSRRRELLVDTPTAAEIILAIAQSDDFAAHTKAKKWLVELARYIAGRYSGHPKI